MESDNTRHVRSRIRVADGMLSETMIRWLSSPSQNRMGSGLRVLPLAGQGALGCARGLGTAKVGLGRRSRYRLPARHPPANLVIDAGNASEGAEKVLGISLTE